MKINSFLKTVSALIVAFLFLVPPLANAKNAKKEQPNNQVKYLFVQSASKAKITAHSTNKDQYLLTLVGVSPVISYFSDRPYRIAGHMKIEKFGSLWKEKGKDSFRDDPPNAELVAIQSEDKVLNYTVELNDPKYDQQASTVTYTIKSIKGSDMPLPTDAILNHAFLFIDDVCLSCWGS